MFLEEAVASMQSAVESRDGYSRSAFRHWNADNHPADDCSTRNEVLLDEAVEPRGWRHSGTGSGLAGHGAHRN
jgi:hypothetical protein